MAGHPKHQTEERDALVWHAIKASVLPPYSASTKRIICNPTGSSISSFSTDPAFVSKVRDLAGLCLNPPDQALVHAIEAYTRANNQHPKPFLWTAPLRSILSKLRKHKETVDTTP